MNAIVTSQVAVALEVATDDALVACVREGSRPAVGELYQRHSPKRRAALRKARVSRDDAEDIVQNVFVVLLNDPRFTPAPGRVGAWLQGVAAARSDEARRAGRGDLAGRGRDDRGRGAAG
jgi:DNA-directed RNA polymerase specialized sigma24 family protein